MTRIKNLTTFTHLSFLDVTVAPPSGRRVPPISFCSTAEIAAIRDMERRRQ